jgi:hypothetical protein
LHVKKIVKTSELGKALFCQETLRASGATI